MSEEQAVLRIEREGAVVVLTNSAGCTRSKDEFPDGSS